MGLHEAGFEVVGVDIEPKRARRYPFTFICADALSPPVQLEEFDLIWASPPCQAYTEVFRGRPEMKEKYPDLLPDTRELLAASGRPWIMENVPGAPLRADVVLTGAMFDLDIVRRRHFECEGFTPPFSLLVQHMGRTVSNGDLATVAGAGANNAWNLRRQAEKKFGRPMKWRDLPPDLKDKLRRRNCVQGWRDAMGIQWMSRDELREAVPPAYSRFIATAAVEQIA